MGSKGDISALPPSEKSTESYEPLSQNAFLADP
jgi:hypothetical protein